MSEEVDTYRELAARTELENRALGKLVESLRAQLAEANRKLQESEADAKRYHYLIGKVFTRGETCLALYEEFGGNPFQGETIRQFMDRYIDATLSSKGEENG